MNDKNQKDADNAALRTKQNNDFIKLLTTTCPILWRPAPGRQRIEKPSVGNGWKKLVFELSVALEKEIESCQGMYPLERLPFIVQVKEKFGHLAFYVSHTLEPIEVTVNNLINKAVTESTCTCEICGDSGQTRHKWPDLPSAPFGWVRTLCETHWYEEAEKRAEARLQPDSVSMRTTYDWPNEDIKNWLEQRKATKNHSDVGEK